jgi:hypothetical protein
MRDAGPHLVPYPCCSFWPCLHSAKSRMAHTISTSAAIATTLILLGINLFIAITFGLLAMRSSPSVAEREALRVRQQSLDAARGALSPASHCPGRESPSASVAQQRPTARSQIKRHARYFGRAGRAESAVQQYDLLSTAAVKQIAKNATHSRSD